MSQAIVIGGGVAGLVAAAYLARAGKKVILLEAQDQPGGFAAVTSFGEGFSASTGAQTLYALDPQVLADLKLARHGLKFAARDMALVGLDGNGKHIVLQRDVHATTANIAVHSVHDARAWPHFRRELFALARALRPLWFGESGTPEGGMQRRITRLANTGAMAWLESWFESDLLKATLCFDALDGGLSPLEPGSALTLAWHAAQEVCGLQGAIALASGGTLVESLVTVARNFGVNIQTSAPVVALLSDSGNATGVRLESGETHAAPQILSSLPRDEVLRTMLPPLAAGVAQATRHVSGARATGSARLLLAFRDPPRFSGSAPLPVARFILAENPAVLANADLVARTGHLADEMPVEVVISIPSDTSHAQRGPSIVSMLLRPIPAKPVGGWQSFTPRLVERAVQAFERVAPGSAAKIVAAKVFTPDNVDGFSYRAPANVERLLSGYEMRMRSPLRGLWFCGADAEPVSAVSGRAARLAAAMLAVQT